jgi:hypothetical protein
MNRRLLAAIKKHGTAGAAAILFTPAGVPARIQAQTGSSASATGQTATGKLMCNITALSPADRAIHQRLTERLIATRTAVVEYSKGYEFQYQPSDVSVAELAGWVANEAKCCPFFDFHIDLEQQGKLVCLRLTGNEEIKDLIREEFSIPEKK